MPEKKRGRVVIEESLWVTKDGAILLSADTLGRMKHALAVEWESENGDVCFGDARITIEIRED